MNKASSRADNERVTSKNLVVVNAIALCLAVVSLLAIVIFSIAFGDTDLQSFWDDPAFRALVT